MGEAKRRRQLAPRPVRTAADLSGDPSTVHVFGMGLGDEFFSSERGAWNVTRAKQLIAEGRGGEVYQLPFAPLWEACGHLEVDRAKLDRLRALGPRVWHEPLIHVVHGDPAPSGEDMVYLIDGVHRLNLWAELRRKGWAVDSVPSYVLDRAAERAIAVQIVRGDGVPIDANAFGDALL